MPAPQRRALSFLTCLLQTTEVWIRVVGMNDPSDPVLVRVVDGNDASSQPVQFQGHFVILNGTLANGLTQFYQVPAGKRLVIEYISARADSLAANDTLDLTVSTTVGGVMMEHYLGLVGPKGRPKIDSAAQASQILSQLVRLYADPGTDVSVGGSRVTRTDQTFIVMAMSGYFVDAP